MFPGVRSIKYVGGWPVVFTAFAFFYVLAFCGTGGETWENGCQIEAASRIATTMIGFASSWRWPIPVWIVPLQPFKSKVLTFSPYDNYEHRPARITYIPKVF